MKQYTRQELDKRLRDKIASGKPLVGSGAANPLIAKTLEDSGCDFVFAYCTGIARINGYATRMGTLPYGDADERAVKFAHQASKVLTEIPVICGVGPGDPTMGLERLTERYMSLGYSGFINFPCTGDYLNAKGIPSTIENYCQYRNIGVDDEVRFIKYWHDNNIFTFGYAFDEYALKSTIQAGVDVIIPHMGLTVGGLVGSQAFELDDKDTTDAQYEKLNQMVELCYRENPDVIVIAHGGILSGPDEMKIAYERSRCKGFIGASSSERMPIEKGGKALFEKMRTLKRRK